MEVKARAGQTLADIAIQEYGTLEAAMELARVNGLSLTDIPVPGSGIQLPDKVFDRAMARHCKEAGVSPATQHPAGKPAPGIFTGEFTEEFV